MHFKLTGENRLFLVSDATTGQPRFLVEAKDELQALVRASQVVPFTATPDMLITFEQYKEPLPIPLPHFMEGYFAIMGESDSDED